MHNFFRRHVYGASLSHMSRRTAMFVTFLISALAHELVMACITKKVRGYGFAAMMMQLPIVMVQRMKWVRGKKLFNVSGGEPCMLVSLIYMGVVCVCDAATTPGLGVWKCKAEMADSSALGLLAKECLFLVFDDLGFVGGMW